MCMYNVQENTKENCSRSHGLCPLSALAPSSQTGPPSDRSSRSERTWPEDHDSWVILKADVTRAHRRIKVLPEEWKYRRSSVASGL